MGSRLDGYRALLWGVENVLELDRAGGCTTLEYTKCHSTLHFKMFNFISRELHLNRKNSVSLPGVGGESRR